MATTVYPFGSQIIAVPAGESIAVFTQGDNAATVYRSDTYPNFPSSWSLLGTVLNTSTTFGPYTPGVSIRIDAGANEVLYNVGVTPVISDPVTDIVGAETPFDVTGVAAAQGGTINVTGGTSSTTGNAGGPANLTGGTPGATGIGGTANVVGGIGGATSGAGGAATLTGGAATAAATAGGAATIRGGTSTTSAAGGAVNITGGSVGTTGIGGLVAIAGAVSGSSGARDGGAASLTGGAGHATSTGVGGAATLKGGASGGGATGDGGDAVVTGGAAASTNGNGGSVLLTPGVKAGTGLDGGVFNRGTFRFGKQATPATAADTDSLTDAQMVAGLIVATPTAAAAYTMRTGTQLKAALPADIAADDAFDLTIINLGGAGDDITLTAAADITIVGSAVVTVAAPSQGTFRFRYTTGVTFIAYRIS